MDYDHRREFFDHHAPHWDENYPPDIYRQAVEAIESLMLKPGEIILDLGCGSGVLLPILREMTGDDNSVFGIDFSTGMLSRIPSEYRRNVICADAASIPFPDSFFDRVIAFAAFPHFNRREQTISEVFRVLKRRGKFYVIHLLSSEELKTHHRHAGAPVKDDLLPPPEHFQKILGDAGFEVVKITDNPGLYIMEAFRK
ncbi:MAG: methyltransferase domain-containing protein [candidate division Zixibacteria bacterium]|nr:methyltransferase domain-containing protein [candidate division Zixibacteria bacterium]